MYGSAHNLYTTNFYARPTAGRYHYSKEAKDNKPPVTPARR